MASIQVETGVYKPFEVWARDNANNPGPTNHVLRKFFKRPGEGLLASHVLELTASEMAYGSSRLPLSSPYYDHVTDERVLYAQMCAARPTDTTQNTPTSLHLIPGSILYVALGGGFVRSLEESWFQTNYRGDVLENPELPALLIYRDSSRRTDRWLHSLPPAARRCLRRWQEDSGMPINKHCLVPWETRGREPYVEIALGDGENMFAILRLGKSVLYGTIRDGTLYYCWRETDEALEVASA